MSIFIENSAKESLLTLKVVTSSNKLHSLIEKKEWNTTLISEEKVCYLFVDKENANYNFQSVYDYFVSFSSHNARNWNIDIKSFVAKNLSEEEIVQAITEGIFYGNHEFVTYKTDKKESRNIDYFLITTNKEAKSIFLNSLIKSGAVNFARDLQDMPPNELHPKEFAEMIKKIFDSSFYEEVFQGVIKREEESKNNLGLFETVRKMQKIMPENLDKIEVGVLGKKHIEKNKMGLLLAVNAGSHHEPRVVIIRYMGDPKSKETLGLIGKGITFDSGGYNLKSSLALETMKFDMSGAAIVCSSFLTLVAKKPKINVVAVACLTENAIGGHAILTESVVTSMSGKTVEINNTDAEGRLVLADGITYAIQKEKITKIITVATLTGAVVSALGENLTGVMTNNRKFYRELRQAFARSRERYWELPIIPENIRELKDNTSIADISNISDKGGRYTMGSSSGGAFLQEFVQDLPFIHCDIAGTAVKNKNKRGTGVMVKTLAELFNNEK